MQPSAPRNLKKRPRNEISNQEKQEEDDPFE